MKTNTVAITDCNSYHSGAVSEALDRLFSDLGLDKSNPFGSFIKPGMRVFIKPNWVASRWRESCPHKDDLYCVITHPAVIEAVADRAAVALQGKGEIIIGDNPSIDADFEELMRHTGIRRLESKYDVPCHIYDLRPLICPSLAVYGQRDKMVRQPGDPNGQVEVNLGAESLLYAVNPELFHGVFDQREDTVAAHTGDRQLYTFSKSLYDADVYISIPKLKTHQKVGATLNMKGLVGAVTVKDQLVHWRVGYPEVGGDEYQDQESYERGQRAKVTHRGSWPGNDTIWRMVADLYKVLMRNSTQKHFSVIDGIMAGDGQGPFCPNAKYATTLIAGSDLLLTDIVAARYMGIVPSKLKYLNYFMENGQIDPDRDICVMENGARLTGFFASPSRYKDFRVVDQWSGIKVEL